MQRRVKGFGKKRTIFSQYFCADRGILQGGARRAAKPGVGQTIRRLRKERNLTQEELAEQLNVTAKAVSKWENETGLPDISQVVPLANVFGVPTDILFGTANLDQNKEVARIIDEASAPRRLTYETDDDDFAAAQTEYETYIAALGDYPNNVRLLYAALGSGANLADDYAERGDHARAAELRQECVHQANVILHRTDDTTTLLNTRMWLVHLRCDMKEYARAEEEAEQMPHGFSNECGLMKAWIKRAAGDTDGEIEARCNNIAGLPNVLADEIGPLGWAYADKGQYEDAIRVYRTLFDMLPVLYGDEPYTPPCTPCTRLALLTAVSSWGSTTKRWNGSGGTSHTSAGTPRTIIETSPLPRPCSAPAPRLQIPLFR